MALPKCSRQRIRREAASKENWTVMTRRQGVNAGRDSTGRKLLKWRRKLWVHQGAWLVHRTFGVETLGSGISCLYTRGERSTLVCVGKSWEIRLNYLVSGHKNGIAESGFNPISHREHLYVLAMVSGGRERQNWGCVWEKIPQQWGNLQLCG